MVNSSICLEAPTNFESKSPNLERTFAIDTTIYILNRLFQDVPRCVRSELFLRQGKKALDFKDVDNKKDVLKMVKSVNKSTINENVYKSEVETTSQKGKKAKRKGSVSA
ncbi:uncharacterized protein OCT59_019295 [Rhizophagus irregularis]|uniref:Uncharacterized protein n=1 Tax=Rhizophagus irregularis (strain DAOM 181602 / DAOM 197198 / MUCL 43194) TaxID=747089 RepID=U9U8F2_RHIID|nr:hypothetical protein OCT59_019295 [Rhizophagus irregularis]GBC33749.1 hypothetical protein GLOIN_2v1762127 [Rhizophagus irregularis DAOM 181602=DAOM 197198]CAG8575335.1 1126_t:CDS:2 [Rhizophagus irregularis]